MKLLSLFIIGITASVLFSCTEKIKETTEYQPIKIEPSEHKTSSTPVQIPMHGTKENSSSGRASFQIKEDMRENSSLKKTTEN